LPERTLASHAPPAAERTASSAMNEAAFEMFYAKTARPLWAYLNRVSGNAHLADDLLQETFYRLLRATRAPDMDDAGMKSYLYKIATNLLNDHWRHQKREHTWITDAPFEEATSHSQANAADTVLGADMTQVFERMKPQERSLLWLAYVEGYDHKEIAAVLDLKEKSVRVLLFRARQNLAELLKPQKSYRSEVSQ
jgi:RNA polymerase sigma-70 factor (ECF subfamily)